VSALPRLSARAVALEVLGRYDARHGDAGELLHSALEKTDRTGQATDLVYGVIRNMLLLDWLLAQIAQVNRHKVKPAVWNILRLGVYELIFAPKTAEYAILNEAVNLARRRGSRKTAGFVNAVLRQLQRQIADRNVRMEDQRYDDRSVILRADGSGCAFRSPLLPSPQRCPDEYLHLVWSLPRWLVQQWVQTWGLGVAARICRACNRHPSVIAWPNTQRIEAEELAERLAAEGVACRFWPELRAVQLHCSGPLNALNAFGEGLFYVQDPAAQAAAAFLDPKSGDTVVDMCAAPGGKSIACALKMKDTGRILASDISPVRLEQVNENVRRLGLSCIRCVSKEDLEKAVRSLKRIDTLILDVPCSNTGVLARRPEARHRLAKGLPLALVTRQQELLAYAKSLLRPGSALLYSTCSILPQENTLQIQDMLKRHPDWVLLKEKIVLPSTENAENCDHDGGYTALLQIR
jgi:16S rRNA (cytosine967-C5)-methyltransferase